ncbi:MAG: sugar phosphate isomerase/epimerase [Armatimonadota bacterium]|nr:MAG: sugar phosphate isomerase/epimerase [Armatimonadota bacterium]
MLRPCVFTDEISQDLEHALDVAEEFGVRAVELRGVWDESIVEQPDEEVARIRDILVARGFTVASIATGFYKCDLPGFPAREGVDEQAAAATVEQHVAMLRRAVELCRVLDAPVIRGFAFWRPAHVPVGIERDASGPSNKHLREADVPREAWTRMVAAFEEPVRIIESAGVVFGLENEHACGVGRGDETARFIEDLGSPSLRVAWDPGNAFFSGEVPYPDGYDHIRPYVAHVHVKDAAVEPDTGKARWVVMGTGEIDWPRQFRALIEGGYEGAVSLETHYTPAGGTREDGSRLCMAAMMDMLRDAGWHPD